MERMHTGTAAPEILLCLARFEGLAKSLARSGQLLFTVWPDNEVLSERVAVIVADSELPGGVVERFGPRITAGEIAVCAIDSDQPSDLRLPADTGPRELETTLRLLVQIALLRRANRQVERLRESLEDLAHRDSLTGLPNRRAWDRELPRRVEQARLVARSLCVAMVDVDFFKRVNDDQGHAAGDQVLKESATQMRRALRENDFLARLGGDEFGLLIDDVDWYQAQSILDRMRSSVSVHLACQQLPAPTLSAGFVLVAPHPCTTAAALYAAAAKSLRQAKQRSRNCTIGMQS